MRPASCGGPLRFRLTAAAPRKLKPVALINERDGQQQHAQHNEADDAIPAVELRNVVNEDFDGRGGDEDESLPAHEAAAPQKSHNHQHGAVSHPERGKGEVALNLDAMESGEINAANREPALGRAN